MQSSPRSRRLGALALLLVAALVLGACSDDDGEAGGASTTTTAAGDQATVPEGAVASVNGIPILAEDLDAELDAILGNDAYLSDLEDIDVTVVDPDTGEPDPAFVAQVLSRRIFLTLVEAEAEARGLEPDDSIRTIAEGDVVQGLGGAEVVDGFPDEYRERLLSWAGASLALQVSFLGLDSISDEALLAWYESDPTQLDEVCARHILVQSQSEADDLLARLDAGEDFSTLASAESIDTSSAENGGDLGCLGRGQFVEPFENAAFGATVGEVVGPVATEFGWHLIVVDERRSRTPSQLGTDFGPTVLALADGAFQSWAEDTLARSTVVVDPAYGTWVVDDRAGPAVVPPSE